MATITMKRLLLTTMFTLAVVSAANAEVVDTRTHIAITPCPSGQITEPCKLPTRAEIKISPRANPRGTLITKEKFFAPAEFEHPYNGPITVLRNAAQCPKIAANSIVLGCSWLQGRRCLITIASDDVLKREGIGFYDVFRHEMAHCVGWPADHPNARGIE